MFALVGDNVGTGGVILPHPDPIAASITYRGIPLALQQALTTPHVSIPIIHPDDPPIISVLTFGSQNVTVGGKYRLVRIGDMTSCGDPVIMNPAIINPALRATELPSDGSPQVAGPPSF